MSTHVTLGVTSASKNKMSGKWLQVFGLSVCRGGGTLADENLRAPPQKKPAPPLRRRRKWTGYKPTSSSMSLTMGK